MTEIVLTCVAVYFFVGACIAIGIRLWLGPPARWEKYILVTLLWPVPLLLYYFGRVDE